METSEQINEIATAIAKAQATIGHATKASDNPFFKSKYADLAAVKDACQAQLSENGIAVVQAPTTNDDGSVTMFTRFMHTSGQWVETHMSAHASPDNKGNITAQALGSVCTYLRRYSLAAMANVATEDDDGEGAAGRTRSDGDKVKPTGKPEPDTLNVKATDYIVPDEFWERQNLGLASEKGWKVGEWLGHFEAYIQQAPDDVNCDRFWNDNKERVEKLSQVRQYWCREIWTARMSEIIPHSPADLGPLNAG